MIFTRLRIQNLFCFKDSEIDLTFQRKPATSTIDYEFLDDRPNLNFKRVCILSSANAAGKTSFAKLLCSVQNYICRRHIAHYLKDAIAYADKPAVLQAEFITRNNENKPFLNRITLNLIKSKEFNELFIDNVEYASVYIRQYDTIGSARSNLQTAIKERKDKGNYTYLAFKYASSESEDIIARSEFEQIQFSNVAWNYEISHFDGDSRTSKIIDERLLTSNVLNSIMKTFDNSIDVIEDVYTGNTDHPKLSGFSVRFKNGEDLLLDDEFQTSSNINRLSSGTIQAINIARFYGQILFNKKSGNGGTYFLDEKMSHAHSEVEQAMLNTIIEALPKEGQFFYTTHNYDILDMNLPTHSFTFLKKIDEDSVFVDPTDSFKKNDRSLLNYVKNDIFMTLPDTSLLDNLLEE